MAWQIPIFFFAGGGFLFVYGLFALKRKRLLENTPTSKIRSIAMGPVEIKGNAISDKPFKSPMTGLPCVYLSINIQEYRSSGKSGRWVTIWTDLQGRYFQLKDNTGKVTIDSLGAKIDVKAKNYSHSSLWNKNMKLIDFVEAKGFKTKTLFGLRKNLRVVEKPITLGKELYIFGNAENNPLVEDGTTEKNEDDIIIKRSKGVPFFISEHKEEDLTKKYKNWVTWGIPAGIVCVALGILIGVIMFSGGI